MGVNNVPIIEKCPHRVSWPRISKAVSHSQGKCGIWRWLHDGNLHIHSFTKGQSQWKLFLGNKGCKGCICSNKHTHHQLSFAYKVPFHSILVPVAILICTPMDPSAMTGGGLVTAYKDRSSAARFRSEESYSHWTWRLKTPKHSSPPVLSSRRRCIHLHT